MSVYQRIVDTIYCYKNRSCKLRLAGLNILKITTMKKIIILIFLIGLFFELKAQRSNKLFNVDKTMLQISDSSTFSTQTIAEYINLKFFTQSKKARAIFIWISENIYYDIDNEYSDSIFQNDEILKTRKGLCNNFANLYSDIANKIGVKTYIITGYTRKNGRVNYNPHAWCASMIDSTWYLVDPTWGSGHITNRHFIKKINNDYFMIKPNRFIKTHIPFDPLWQFLNYPITKREFLEGKSKPDNKEFFFNFIDTIKTYEKQSEIEQLANTYIRIKTNGVTSYLDQQNLYHLRLKYYHRTIEEQYNLSLKFYYDGMYLSNKYIDYKNNYYLPYKNDSYIKQMLIDIENKFNLSLFHLEEIKNPSSNVKINVSHLYKSIKKELVNLNENKNKLDMYLEIAKNYRKSLTQDNE